VALTTAESVRELGLAEGSEVIASVKATNVVVGLPQK
jgi:molybdopterin-binding protein